MKTSEKKLTYLKEYRFINRDRLRAYHLKSNTNKLGLV